MAIRISFILGILLLSGCVKKNLIQVTPVGKEKVVAGYIAEENSVLEKVKIQRDGGYFVTLNKPVKQEKGQVYFIVETKDGGAAIFSVESWGQGPKK